ncbi:short-chain dehydrogenase [Phaeosphaeria sp. MPI-PUGE-AT-0046c]|nr:short-chain dehydrogenase [Phaeosphaeria sp. MPI-PUGE-AT-0046c]
MSSLRFGFETTAEEVVSTFAKQVEKKTILITGVTPGGLGLYTAKALAVHTPTLLILAARSQSTLGDAVAEINKISPCAMKALLIDLSSMKSVRAAAEEVNAWTDIPKIDILINNAGVMSMPWGKTVDGIEQHFATNHVGHFLFTNLIMNKIIAARGRIISVSSGAHLYGPVRFDDYNFKDGTIYDANKAYGQSKSANMLFAVSLAKKLESRGVLAFSLHPGIILTNLTRHTSDDELKAMGMKDEHGKAMTVTEGPWRMKNVSQGSATTLVAALDPSITHRSGSYLADCQVDHKSPVMEYALDQSNAEKLWAMSEKLVGQKFEY